MRAPSEAAIRRAFPTMSDDKVKQARRRLVRIRDEFHMTGKVQQLVHLDRECLDGHGVERLGTRTRGTAMARLCCCSSNRGRKRGSSRVAGRITSAGWRGMNRASALCGAGDPDHWALNFRARFALTATPDVLHCRHVGTTTPRR